VLCQAIRERFVHRPPLSNSSSIFPRLPRSQDTESGPYVKAP